MSELRHIDGNVVGHVALADDAPVKFSTQEGGRTIISGTFTPTSARVKIDIDVAGSFRGWGAGGVDFHLGVVDSPTDPWEPGGKNRIVEGNFAGRGPLPGVRPGSYKHFSVGFLAADTITPQIARTIMLDDVEPGLTYDWELRCGGASFFKWAKFAKGSRPTALTVTPDNLYVWALLSGSRRLALVQLGWAPLWSRFSYSPEMLCVAEIPLPGAAGGIAAQPKQAPLASPAGATTPRSKGRYLALVDEDHDELVIVDQERLEVDGSYPLPGGAVPHSRNLVWDRFGDKLYVGGRDGNLYRFDLATRSFDQVIAVDETSEADIVPLSLLLPPVSADPTEPAHHLWCSSVQRGLIAKVGLDAGVAHEFHRYPEGVTAPTCGAARRSTGGLLVVESTNEVRCFDAAGNSTSSWTAVRDGATVRNVSSSICLDDDEIRAFWTIDDTIGWAWIDGSHEIESRPDGWDWISETFTEVPRNSRERRVINKLNLSQFFTTDHFGDIANTELEGTLVAIPDEDTVIHWPGGAVEIRPDPWGGDGVVGTEHASVTFTGAEATGA